MQTPVLLSMAQFFESVKRFLDSRCVLEHDQLFCSECGSAIRYANSCLHISSSDMVTPSGSRRRSAPSGDDVWTVHLPYCPHCEPTPDRNGSVHVPLRSRWLN